MLLVNKYYFCWKTSFCPPKLSRSTAADAWKQKFLTKSESLNKAGETYKTKGRKTVRQN